MLVKDCKITKLNSEIQDANVLLITFNDPFSYKTVFWPSNFKWVSNIMTKKIFQWRRTFISSKIPVNNKIKVLFVSGLKCCILNRNRQLVTLYTADTNIAKGKSKSHRFNPNQVQYAWTTNSNQQFPLCQLPAGMGGARCTPCPCNSSNLQTALEEWNDRVQSNKLNARFYSVTSLFIFFSTHHKSVKRHIALSSLLKK